MKNQKLLIGIGLVVILGVAGAFVLFRPSSPTETPRRWSLTRTDVPKGVVVPSATSTDVSKGVAVPKIVAPGSEGNADAAFRDFGVLKIEANRFDPDTVIVKKGDILRVNIQAVDKAYDFIQPDYGINLAIGKGETRLLEFWGGEEGRFTFYCGSCGGPEKGPVGYFIVVP